MEKWPRVRLGQEIHRMSLELVVPESKKGLKTKRKRKSS